MKISMVMIFLVLLFALGACSGEDPQPPQTPSPKVVQPIKPSSADIEKPTTIVEEKKPQGEEKAPVERPASPVVKPEPAPAPVVEEKKPEEKKIVSEKKDKDEPGVYSVKKGDSLSSISANPDILKDPLKWPILLRLNRDKLGEWAPGDDFPDRELPEGTKLKVMTVREARTSLKKETGIIFVVNVLSATTNAEIVPTAVTLVKQGYPVYIVRANVKGKEYMRLRVGFFVNKSEADEMGRKIKEQMNFKESWTTRADKEEYEEVAGFFKSLEKR